MRGPSPIRDNSPQLRPTQSNKKNTSDLFSASKLPSPHTPPHAQLIKNKTNEIGCANVYQQKGQTTILNEPIEICTPASKGIQNIEKYKLTPKQIEQYYADGYLVLKGVFNEEELADMKTRSRVILEEARKLAEERKGHYSTATFREEFNITDESSSNYYAVKNDDGSISIKLISWICGSDEQLKEYGRRPELTIPVAQLLYFGTDISDEDEVYLRHLINQYHPKSQGDRVKFELHQDIQHRYAFNKDWQDVSKNGNGSFVQTLTALDDANKENGTIYVIPNSHHKDLSLYKCANEKEILEKVQAEYGDWKSKAIPINLNAGDIFLMNPFVIHYSDANQSDKERGLFINGFCIPEANINHPYPGKGSSRIIQVL